VSAFGYRSCDYFFFFAQSEMENNKCRCLCDEWTYPLTSDMRLLLCIGSRAQCRPLFWMGCVFNSCRWEINHAWFDAAHLPPMRRSAAIRKQIELDIMCKSCWYGKWFILSRWGMMMMTWNVDLHVVSVPCSGTPVDYYFLPLAVHDCITFERYLSCFLVLNLTLSTWLFGEAQLVQPT